MAQTKYNIDFNNSAIVENIDRITNQIFKLLPNREEGIDWEIPLKNLIIEVAGMSQVLIDHQSDLFALVCRLEGMLTLTGENDFLMFRKDVFECLSILKRIKICLD